MPRSDITGGSLRVETLRREPHHVQLAARQAIVRDALGMKRAEVIAGADDHGAGRNAAAAGFEPPRLGAVNDGFAQEGRRRGARQGRRASLRDGLARSRRGSRADCRARRQSRRCRSPSPWLADLGRLEQPAFGAHVGGHELLRARRALRAGGRPRAAPRCRIAMPAASATSSQTSRERMARCQHSPACWPVTVMKPKFRIEAPLACASRSTTDHALAEPRGGQRMGQAANAGADHRDVE